MVMNTDRQLYQGERFFSSVEESRLSPRFRKELMLLLHYGQISQIEAEAVINTALGMSRPEIGIKELVELLKEVVHDPARQSLILPRLEEDGPPILH